VSIFRFFGHIWPTLANFAIEILSIPAMSDYLEEAFSISGFYDDIDDDV
jgi:hAT family C-terminal dimerisation region